MIGTQILNYKIKSFLGDGGMGTVYLAEHTKLERKVAIKVLHPHLASNESIRTRFINEAKTMSGLQHPNIVGLQDYHEDQFGLYLIMEYVEGLTVDKYIENVSGPIPEEKVIKIFKQALEGFQYAHNKLIVHRDIKPSNLIITKDEKIKVLDFGIAKILGNESYKLTKTGAHTGTVYYMSPEQVRGQEVDAKSDIYSLGITLYQMLTGYNPYFDLTTEYEIFEKIVKIPLADPRIIYPAVSEHMCKVIAKATQKNPSDRFKSCDEFALGLIDENSFNLNASSDDSIAKPTDNTTTTNIKIPDQAKKKKPLFFIVTILLIILVTGFLLFKYFSDSSNNVPTPPVKDSTVENKNKEGSEIKTPVIEGKSGKVSTQKDTTANSKIKVNPAQDPNAPIKFYVKAKSLDDLRSLIKSKSSSYMKNKGYIPANASFNPNTLSFSCDLIPQNSSFTKITIVYGPIGSLCEACINTVNKNPGSEVLIDMSDASFNYNIISIAE